MKATLLIAILALGCVTAAADPSDPGHLLAQISKNEAPANWYLSDGRSLTNVRVTKTTKGKWVKVEYSRSFRRVPAPPDGKSGPMPEPIKERRLQCWVNIDHVVQIIPQNNRITDPDE